MTFTEEGVLTVTAHARAPREDTARIREDECPMPIALTGAPSTCPHTRKVGAYARPDRCSLCIGAPATTVPAGVTGEPVSHIAITSSIAGLPDNDRLGPCQRYIADRRAEREAAAKAAAEPIPQAVESAAERRARRAEAARRSWAERKAAQSTQEQEA